MAVNESLRAHTDRLAGLLADARGTEILRELQLLAVGLHGDATAAPLEIPAACVPISQGTGQVGVWQLDRGPDGVALHRGTGHDDAQYWAKIEHLPLRGGARRVALIGESAARGWIYDPDFTPALALQRQLELASPGGYQVIDLAKSGAFPEELTGLTGQLPLLEPDCVVVFAGNNWAGLPMVPDHALLDDMAAALRTGGYTELRRQFVDRMMLPRIRDFLAGVLALHQDNGAQIVIVVPEFNLRGWTPPADIDVPALQPDVLAKWYELRSQATTALRERRWADVAPITAQMRLLDSDTSPVPGVLLASAARELGDELTWREGLEQSRDSLVGIGVLSTPRISHQVHELLTGFAAEHGFRCVDLRTELAAGDQLAPPDPGSFLDYCHLSDEAIEKTMSAVADAVLGLPAGTTPPGPGAPKQLRAMVRMLAAAQCAYLGQPAEVVAPQLRAAVDGDPQISTLMAALLDVLESPGPVWTHAGLATLAGIKSAREIFGPMLIANSRADGMWTLRACLGELLERTPPPADQSDIDLLITADKMDRHRQDCTPRRSYRQITAERSTLAFALHQPAAGVLHLSYRMPAGPSDTAGSVTVNDTPVGTFPTANGWAGAQITIPAAATRPGVNWVHLHWPVPIVDTDEWHATDAATLASGGFPTVVPLFGELFEARLMLSSG